MQTTYCADERRWLPIELTCVEDVTRLDQLLADGWRIEPIGIEGLPFLAFCGRKGDVAIAPRISRMIRSAEQRDAPQRLLLILQRTAPGRRTQRAAFITRSPLGFIDMRVDPRRKGERFVAVFPVGDDATLAIHEVAVEE